MTVPKLTLSDQLLGGALCIGYVMVLVWTAPDLAMSRDESFYRSEEHTSELQSH